MYHKISNVPPLATWSARAIYKGYRDDYFIDLLPDRQGMNGDHAKFDVLAEWLNKNALPALRTMLKEQDVQTDSSKVLEIREFNFVLIASPNASFGYLYLSAGILPVEEAEPILNTASNIPERVLVVDGKRFVWGVPWDVPLPGTSGAVMVNGIGPATVIGYTESEYSHDTLLVLRVKLHNPPKWYVDQHYGDAVRKAKEAKQKRPLKADWLKAHTSTCFDGDFHWNVHQFNLTDAGFKMFSDPDRKQGMIEDQRKQAKAGKYDAMRFLHFGKPVYYESAIKWA